MAFPLSGSGGLQTTALGRRSVGLCLLGALSHLPGEKTLNSTRLVVSSLDADVFVVLSSPSGVRVRVNGSPLEAWATQLGVLGMDDEDARIATASFTLAAFALGALDVGASLAGHAAAAVLGSYEAARDSYAAARHGAALLRDLWRCWESIRRSERDNGFTYEYLAFSRLDLHWFTGPPTLPVLIKADPLAIWLPEGHDCGTSLEGDGFALVPRPWARRIFDRWPRLLNGTNYLHSPDGRFGVLRPLDGLPSRVSVRRFAAVAARLCAPGSREGACSEWQRWPEVKQDEWTDQRRLSGLDMPVLGAKAADDPEAADGFRFECFPEATAAHLTAMRLKVWKVWEWQFTALPADELPARPACFNSPGMWSRCCARSAASMLSSAAKASPDADDSLCWLAERRWRCCAQDPDAERFAVRRSSRRPVGGLRSEHVKRLRDALSALRSPAILLMSTWQALCHYDNFLAHAARFWSGPIVTVAFDGTSVEWCRRLQGPAFGGLDVRCVDLNGSMPGDDALGVPGADSTSSQFVDQNVFHWIIWMKPVIAVHAAANARHGVLIMDTDVLLRGDLLGWITRYNSETNAAHVTFAQDPWEIANLGTLFITQRSLRFVTRWAKFANTSEAKRGVNDQSAFNKLLLEQGKQLDLRFQVIPADVVGQCGDAGTLAVHYNCKYDKTASMLSAGDWIPRSPRCRA